MRAMCHFVLTSLISCASALRLTANLTLIPLTLIPLMLVSLVFAPLSGCSDIASSESEPHTIAYDLEPLTESDGKSDGLSNKFDPEWLMGDLFFLNTSALSVDDLQRFLLDTPYGHKSWLSDFEVNGISASEYIVKIAYDEGINPLLLLARMQVEQSLISKLEAPTGRVRDAALGCGCHDGERCAPQFKGFPNQLTCAAKTLRRLFDASHRGDGIWVAGQPKRTLESEWVRPSNHATAALYAYTPWVLRGRGGNWLAWNITRKFTRFMKEREMLGDLAELDLSELMGEDATWGPEELSRCLYRSGRAFVGDPCGCERDCDFWSGRARGFCHESGFCALPCEGGCPDVLNKAQTFCIEDPAQLGVGICVPKASDYNGHCADLPNTIDDERDRFVGGSSSSPRVAEVCAPWVE